MNREALISGIPSAACPFPDSVWKVKNLKKARALAVWKLITSQSAFSRLRAIFPFYRPQSNTTVPNSLNPLLNQVFNLTVRANFESGNLASVKPVGTLPPPSSLSKLSLRTRKDCEGTQYVSRHSTWFYFAVSGASPGESVQFTIGGLNKQKSLFSDHRPVFRYAYFYIQYLTIHRFHYIF